MGRHFNVTPAGIELIYGVEEASISCLCVWASNSGARVCV